MALLCHRNELGRQAVRPRTSKQGGSLEVLLPGFLLLVFIFPTLHFNSLSNQANLSRVYLTKEKLFSTRTPDWKTKARTCSTTHSGPTGLPVHLDKEPLSALPLLDQVRDDPFPCLSPFQLQSVGGTAPRTPPSLARPPAAWQSAPPTMTATV